MKKLKMVAIIAAITCFTMLQYGCTKQIDLKNSVNSDISIANTLPQKISLVSERMRFNSEKDFHNALTQVRNGEDVTLNHFDGSSDFKSYKALYNELVRDEAKEKLLLENCIITPDGDSYNLVPFMDIASLLNSKLEIEIGGKIYKITRFGTYIIDPSEYSMANKLIDSLYKTNTRLKKERKFSFEEETNKIDLYKVFTGVYRFDTYKRFETEYNSNSNLVLNNIATPSLVDPGTIPSNNLVYTGYTNDKVFNYFNSKTRMRSNFSEYNWSFQTVLGVELICQRKGWTGVWRELNIQELNIINTHTVLNRVPNYESLFIYDIPSSYAVGQPYYFNAPNISTEVAYPNHNAFGVKLSNGRVEYTFLYRFAETFNTSGLGFPILPAPPGTSNKPSYTYLNLGCYVKFEGTWRGIIYREGW